MTDPRPASQPDTSPFTGRLEGIIARHAAATRGPYRWHGNTDTHQAGLAGHVPGLGIVEVITTVDVDRDPNGREAAEMRSDLKDSGYPPEAIDEYVRNWAYDEAGCLRTDPRLALSTPDHMLKAVEEIAVFEVARNQGLPDDTPRDHPQVYRANICGVHNNPNGTFLEESWSDILWLTHTLKAVAAFTQQPPAVYDTDGMFAGLVSAAPGTHHKYAINLALCDYCEKGCSEAAPCHCCWNPHAAARLAAVLNGTDSASLGVEPG